MVSMFYKARTRNLLSPCTYSSQCLLDVVRAIEYFVGECMLVALDTSSYLLTS